MTSEWKFVAIIFFSVMLGKIISSVGALSSPLSYAIGLLVCLTIAYWVTPKQKISLVKWLLISVGVSSALYLVLHSLRAIVG